MCETRSAACATNFIHLRLLCEHVHLAKPHIDTGRVPSDLMRRRRSFSSASERTCSLYIEGEEMTSPSFQASECSAGSKVDVDALTSTNVRSRTSIHWSTDAHRSSSIKASVAYLEARDRGGVYVCLHATPGHTEKDGPRPAGQLANASATHRSMPAVISSPKILGPCQHRLIVCVPACLFAQLSMERIES